MHPCGKGERGGLTKMTLGLDFKSWGGFSEGHWELNSQNELNSGGQPCFSGNVLFLWQHYYQLLTSLCIF